MEKQLVLCYGSEKEMMHDIYRLIEWNKEPMLLKSVSFTSNTDTFDIHYIGMDTPQWFGEKDGIGITSDGLVPLVFACWNEPESIDVNDIDKFIDGVMEALKISYYFDSF